MGRADDGGLTLGHYLVVAVMLAIFILIAVQERAQGWGPFFLERMPLR
jgi:hypothetical protein